MSSISDCPIAGMPISNSGTPANEPSFEQAVERLEKIVGAIRTYHDKAVFDNHIDLFQMIRDYTAMAREVDAPRPAELEHLFAVGEVIEAAMERAALMASLDKVVESVRM